MIYLSRCGAQFTAKMEGMLNDLSIGSDTSRLFDEYIRSNDDARHSLGKTEFSVQVIADLLPSASLRTHLATFM